MRPFCSLLQKFLLQPSSYSCTSSGSRLFLVRKCQKNKMFVTVFVTAMVEKSCLRFARFFSTMAVTNTTPEAGTGGCTRTASGL